MSCCVTRLGGNPRTNSSPIIKKAIRSTEEVFFKLIISSTYTVYTAMFMLMVALFSCFDPQKSVSVTLSVVDKPQLKITSLIKDLAPISRSELQLLKNVSSLETRFKLTSERRLAVRKGDTVTYFPPLEKTSPVTAVVRYVGPLAELAREGHLLGLEVTEPGWSRSLPRAVQLSQYFTCPPGRAVFCNIGEVRPAQNCPDNNNHLLTNKLNNLTLLERKNNLNVNIGSGGSNCLRRIHNDLKNKKVRKYFTSLPTPAGNIPPGRSLWWPG